MIKRIKLSNFRSIESLDFELGALNVLIGRNGSGKSNFLSFFQLLGEGARNNLNDTIVNTLRGFEFLRYLNADVYEPLAWEITIASERNGELYYQGEIGPRGVAGYVLQSEVLSRTPFPGHDDPYKFLEIRDGIVTILKVYQGGQNEQDQNDADTRLRSERELAIAQLNIPSLYPAVDEIYSHLSEWKVFNGFGEQELKQIRSAQTLNVVDPIRLDSDGANLISVLHELANQPQYESTYRRIGEIMQTVFPDFKQFDLPIVAGAQASLSFRSRDLPKSVPALYMSDGQLRFLGLILLLLLPEPPGLILIDEPEIGMHPKMIDIFVELLKDAAQRTQVIVSTHSPQLISSLMPEHLIAVERENGATIIRRPDAARLNRWLDRYDPGYLWTHTTLIEG